MQEEAGKALMWVGVGFLLCLFIEYVSVWATLGHGIFD